MTQNVNINLLHDRKYFDCKGKNVATITILDMGGWSNAVVSIRRSTKGMPPTDFPTPITFTASTKNTSQLVVLSSSDYLVVETTTVETTSGAPVYAMVGVEVSE